MTKHLSIALTLFLLATLVLSSFPNATSMARAATAEHRVATAVQNPQPNFDYLFQYTSFSGAVYQRRAYDGRHIRYALPDSWVTSNALSTIQIRKLIDLTDIYYEEFAEIIGSEPQGEGLLTIAVLPTGIMAGHAGRGFKGIELSDTELSSVLQNLDADTLSPELIHEMAHVFEVYLLWLDLGYADSSHAWTSFWIPFIQSYSRTGSLQLDADSLLQKKLTEYTLLWDTSGTTWQQCVRNGNACAAISANAAWAGLLLRYTKLHGPSALKRVFAYIKNYASSHPATGEHPTNPQTPEERNDLLVQALTAGAQANILCEIDAWHWFVTPEVRATITQNYPQPNLLCADSDNDGFSPLQGDYNDINAAVKPTAIETLNSLDDDCDEITDDILITEAADFPNSPQNAPVVSPPAKVRAHASPSDNDVVLVDTSNFTLPQAIRFNLQSPNTFVGYIRVQPVDLKGSSQSFSVAGGGAQTLILPRATLWAVNIQNATASESDYTLTMEKAPLSSNIVHVNAAANPSNQTLEIRATIDRSLIPSNIVPNAVRFWIGPSGFTLSAPLTPTATSTAITVSLPQGTGPFSVRAQLLRDNTPIMKPSADLWLERGTGDPSTTISDLSIQLASTVPPVITAQQDFNLSFVLTNNGPGPAQNVTVSVPLPPGVAFRISAASAGNTQVQGNNILFTIPQLDGREMAGLSIAATNVSAQGNLTLSATANAFTSDPIQSNNCATTTAYFSSPSPTPTPTPIPTPTPAASPSPSPTPTSTPSATPSPSPTANPSPTPTPTPTPAATPSPSPSPSPTPSPAPIQDLQLLLDQAGPLPFQAAALDSLLFMRDPFPIVNRNDLLNFGTDRNTRVVVFVKNLPTTNLDSASVVVSLTDNSNQVFDLTAEDVRYLSDFGFTQVTFRLPDSAAAGTCTLTIKLGNHASNPGTIRIRNSL